MRSEYQADISAIERCGSDVVTVRLSRPTGFDFVAGQWMILTLPADGAQPLSQTFTICSAPSDGYLEITTRISSSAYKGRLSSLDVGDRAIVSGPGGRLALPEDAARLAFLVGGVGITPVRSMLREAVARGMAFDDALVFYGNRDDSCVPFRAEFEAMAGAGIRVVLCLEQPPRGWEGESGLITATMVRRYLPAGVDDRPFVVAGPPLMVEAMVAVLDDLQVQPERRLVERFGGVRGQAPTGETGAVPFEAGGRP